ncbi:MAG: hypothetical protein IPG59_01860 [Candidatus Melainabacteria bacterium]|nr:MAG: hypothetical protein IPG59_01860 [Candidatus Melainabacteria bacterium]
MWKLAYPASSAEDAFELCTDGMRRTDLRNRLMNVKADYVAAKEKFQELKKQNELHLFSITNIPAGLVANDEFIGLYDEKIRSKKSKARVIFSELMRDVDRCPLCGKTPKPPTLDHHLPKSKFPILAIYPQNLVPVCHECNGLKGDTFPTLETEQILHPYYESIENEQWLFASLTENETLTFNFSVQAASSWDVSLTKRVQNQFDLLKLNERYGVWASVELSDVAETLIDLYNRTGTSGLRNHLLSQASSRGRRNRLNYWMAVTYRTLATNQWFCNGGVLELLAFL